MEIALGAEALDRRHLLAARLHGEHGDESKLIAGGHSLLPLMKLRLAQPSVLIDIGRLSELSYIREELEGNMCRCTGYHNIVKAVKQGASAMGK